LNAFEDELQFNLIVPVRLFRAFLPLIRLSQEKKILVLTSQLGSIELGASLPDLANAYSVAKAGLNM
jgi:NAD(P)-dependent dehydrogenase (short-subunit alcohol dehydrogenase family)